MSVGELRDRSDAAAAGMRALAGLQPGDRVSVLVKPSFEFFVAIFALWKLGAIPVLIDPGMGRDGFLRCVREIKPVGLVAIPAAQALSRVLGSHFATVRSRVSTGASPLGLFGVTLDACIEAGRGAPAAMFEPAEDGQAGIIYTSGSTGPAKGVRYTHRMFRTQARLIAEMYDMKPGDVDVSCFLPFAIFSVVMGVTAVLPDIDFSRPATAPARTVVRAIATHNATQLVGSPAVMVRVGEFCEQRSVRLPSLARVLTFGAPIPPRVHQQFRGFLSPGAQVHTPYGATECLPIATTGSDEILGETAARTLAGEGTCVGRPIREIELRVIRITDDPIAAWDPALAVAPGEVGEVIARGAQVSPLYEEHDAANAESKIRDGDTIWHRMGDLGAFDADGRLWFCGRKSHRVVTADGALVLPVPVEGVFNGDPDVRRTAVVGVRGEPVLVVEAREGVDQGALQRRLLETAAQHDVTRRIRRVLFHGGFPVDRRHNAKIHRPELAVWAAEQG